MTSLYVSGQEMPHNQCTGWDRVMNVTPEMIEAGDRAMRQNLAGFVAGMDYSKPRAAIYLAMSQASPPPLDDEVERLLTEAEMTLRGLAAALATMGKTQSADDAQSLAHRISAVLSSCRIGGDDE